MDGLQVRASEAESRRQVTRVFDCDERAREQQRRAHINLTIFGIASCVEDSSLSHSL